MPFVETEASVRYETVDGKRIPLLQEYNFDGHRNKKIGNTNLLWKNSPYSRVFISNIEPVVESDTIQNQATTSEPSTSLESSSSWHVEVIFLKGLKTQGSYQTWMNHYRAHR